MRGFLAVRCLAEPPRRLRTFRKRSLSVLRVIAFATTIGLSAVAVAFVSADRLAQSAAVPVLIRQVAAPAPIRQTSVPVAEPTVTGTVTQDLEKPKSLPVRTPNGFDSERLNALLRDATLSSPRRR